MWILLGFIALFMAFGGLAAIIKPPAPKPGQKPTTRKDAVIGTVFFGFLAIFFFALDGDDEETATQKAAAPVKSQTAKIILDGKEMQFRPPAIYKDQHVLVPYREFNDDLKLFSHWDEGQQKMTGGRCNIKGIVKVGDKIAYLNSKQITLEVPPENIDNEEVLVPVRFAAEALKLKVEKWDEANLTVYLKTNPCGASSVLATPKKTDDKPKEEKKQEKPADNLEEKPTEKTESKPKQQEELPMFDTSPTPNSGSDVYFRNCSEARAAGAAPLYEGEPGYRSGLDRDKDGVACE